MRRWLVLGVFAAAVWTGCGGSGGSSTTPTVSGATVAPGPSATVAAQSIAFPAPPAAGSTAAVTLPAPGGITPTLSLGSGYASGTQIVVSAANYGQTSSYLRAPTSSFSSCPALIDLTAYVTLPLPISAVSAFSVAYGNALTFLGSGTFTAQIYDAGATQTSGNPAAPPATNGCATAPATTSVLAGATGTVSNGTATFTNFQGNASLSSSLVTKYGLATNGGGTIPAGAVFGFYVTFVAGATPTPTAAATATPTAPPTAAPTATPTATPTPAPTASPTGTSLQSLYQNAGWQSARVTVSFPSSCSMQIATTGAPPTTNPYYLAPATGNQTPVAYTPVSNTGLVVIPAPTSQTVAAVNTTINICPSKAKSTTPTSGGAIGYMISGEDLFDPYESSGTVSALNDNQSYTTTIGGQQVTAYFIDQCNSHSTMTNGQVVWHLHGVPTCLTNQVDGAAGPSHVIGVALDGYPIYGGRDINGNTISTSQLDACNGITSVTPESPNTPIYHYVLPIGVTGTQSSIGCYSGVVPQPIAAAARAKRQYLCGYGYVTPERMAQIRAAALRPRAATVTYRAKGTPLSS